MASAALVKKQTRAHGHRQRYSFGAGRASEFGEAIHSNNLAANVAKGNQRLALSAVTSRELITDPALQAGHCVH